MKKSQIVTYEYQAGVATITMNDGFKNLISPQMLRELNKALDQAEKDSAVVILTGYEDILSAGFDLKVLKSGGKPAYTMLNGGFALTTRLLSFRTPVVIACNGHAVAMGSFLLLSGDYRIGVEGPFKIVANEVSIGLTVPATGIVVCRQRLTPAHFVRAAMQSEVYNPTSAVEAGFLDETVAPADLLQTAKATANRLTQLDLKAHYKTKMRARRKLIRALKRANRFDRLDIIIKGLQAMFN